MSQSSQQNALSGSNPPLMYDDICVGPPLSKEEETYHIMSGMQEFSAYLRTNRQIKIKRLALNGFTTAELAKLMKDFYAHGALTLFPVYISVSIRGESHTLGSLKRLLQSKRIMCYRFSECGYLFEEGEIIFPNHVKIIEICESEMRFANLELSTTLKELILRDNSEWEDSPPHSINEVRGLEKLVLDGSNVIFDLEFMKNARTLKELVFNMCIMEAPDFLKFKNYKKLTRLSLISLDIHDTSDIEFPPKLEYLNLNQNNLDFVDGGNFPKTLLQLDMTNNRISHLSKRDLPESLTELNLLVNELTSLDISHLKSLKKLNVDHNKGLTLDKITFPEGITLAEFVFDGKTYLNYQS